MKKVISIMLCLVLCLTLVVSCGEKKEAAINPDSDYPIETITQKYWYVLGEDLIEYYADYYGSQASDFDLKAMVQGIVDYANGNFTLTYDEMTEIANGYYDWWVEQQSVLANENLAAAEAFLEENKTKEGVVTTESGLQYKVMTQGDGDKPVMGDSVAVNYQLYYADGTLIEDSTVYGVEAEFSLIEGYLIEGFLEGLQLMNVGSTYEFYIHPNLGYGETDTGLGQNVLLIFRVNLASIL